MIKIDNFIDLRYMNINEHFIYKNKIYKIHRSNTCDGCSFNGNECQKNIIVCTDPVRYDKKSVIFELIGTVEQHTNSNMENNKIIEITKRYKIEVDYLYLNTRLFLNKGTFITIDIEIEDFTNDNLVFYIIYICKSDYLERHKNPTKWGEKHIIPTNELKNYGITLTHIKDEIK